MARPKLLILSLGGTITMIPAAEGGITPKLGAAELVASVPPLAEVAEITAETPFRLPSPSLTPDKLMGVAGRIIGAFDQGFDGALVVQGTDTIEESAFLLDLLVPADKPVVITGAMRGADAPGADGPANLLKAFMGDDGRLLPGLPGLGYSGAVIEGMGAGHVLASVAPILGDLAAKIPVVLASRSMTGHVFEETYGYAGAEIDLLKRGLIPSGCLSGLKARLLLALALRGGAGREAAAAAFAPFR